MLVISWFLIALQYNLFEKSANTQKETDVCKSQSPALVWICPAVWLWVDKPSMFEEFQFWKNAFILQWLGCSCIQNLSETVWKKEMTHLVKRIENELISFLNPQTWNHFYWTIYTWDPDIIQKKKFRLTFKDLL